MTNFLDGSKQYTARRRWIFGSHEGAQAFVHTEIPRGKLIAKNIEHFMAVHEPHFKRGFKPKDQDMSFMSDARMTHSPPLTINFGVFAATLNAQCSDEQKDWWLSATRRGGIIGCYAQTELGHGSNVRGLQTTATYDVATQEWVLNTPTVAAVKWWSTSMPLATHATVFAQVFTRGKWHGGHWFMVQLRGADLKPLPGIEVGDVGSMLGDNDTPVGYLVLSNVRVPRRYILERRQHVTPAGEFVVAPEPGSMKAVASAPEKKSKPVDPKMAQALKYVSMMKTRIALASTAAGALAKASVIAARYSCVRRQGFQAGGGSDSHLAPESQVIDYGVQRQRVLRWLSVAYAMKSATRWLVAKRHQVEAGGEIDLDDLPELHASSAGLKAVTCVLAADGIEDLRRSCGGHGYLMSSGIAPLEADFKGPNTTAEGDYVILCLQTARFLIKSYEAALQGKPSSGELGAGLAPLKDKSFDVVRDGRSATRCTPRGRSALTESTFLLGLFQCRSIAAIVRAGRVLDAAKRQGQSQDVAWNKAAPLLYRASFFHIRHFIFDKFLASIRQCEDAACRQVLEKLAVVFALSDFVFCEGWTGLLSYDESVWAEELLDETCASLRPEVVRLTDAFDFPDRILNSTLGRSDGRVYEALLAEARKSGLNVNEQGEPQEVPEFVETLGKWLDKSILAWNNRLPPLPAASKL